MLILEGNLLDIIKRKKNCYLSEEIIAHSTVLHTRLKYKGFENDIEF